MGHRMVIGDLRETKSCICGLRRAIWGPYRYNLMAIWLPLGPRGPEGTIWAS